MVCSDGELRAFRGWPYATVVVMMEYRIWRLVMETGVGEGGAAYSQETRSLFFFLEVTAADE